MIIYTVIDNNKGLMFNNRRQSQDKVLREDVLQDCRSMKLWMNEYSEMQFASYENPNIIVDNDFLNKAGDNDACFIENISLLDYESRISRLVLYRWNRDYPADFYFNIDLTEWKLISSIDFTGSSHEKITKEVWVQKC